MTGPRMREIANGKTKERTEERIETKSDRKMNERGTTIDVTATDRKEENGVLIGETEIVNTEKGVLIQRELGRGTIQLGITDTKEIATVRNTDKLTKHLVFTSKYRRKEE